MHISRQKYPKSMDVNEEKTEIVDKFCYIGVH